MIFEIISHTRANIQNLKIAESSYASADSIEDLEDKISSKSTLAKTARQSLIDTEHQLKELGEILKYANDYQTNKVYNFRYKKSKDPDAYFRSHETELTLFEGAKNMLKRFGINPKNFNLEQLQTDYNTLQAKKTELQKTYKSAEKKVADLNVSAKYNDVVTPYPSSLIMIIGNASALLYSVLIG